MTSDEFAKNFYIEKLKFLKSCINKIMGSTKKEKHEKAPKAL